MHPPQGLFGAVQYIVVPEHAHVPPQVPQLLPIEAVFPEQPPHVSGVVQMHLLPEHVGATGPQMPQLSDPPQPSPVVPQL